ncbi:hypothetical protein B0H16DRAFT_1459241 [Mycena metata]|uniref:Uncharacterized protein n=1 Tax=Mycena metata TaxID=1033252 RepID=A0AAD7NAL9_9AGAR|nr:hypothetical protein B0H16DRAFT_1459241 [Mycena metata]
MFMNTCGDCVNPSHYVTADSLGGGRSTFDGSALRKYVANANGTVIWERSKYTFEFQCPGSEVEDVLSRHKDCVSTVVPINDMYKDLARHELALLAKFHHVHITSRMSASVCRLKFADHSCDSCDEVSSIFKCVRFIPDGEDIESLDKPAYRSRERQAKERQDIVEYVKELKMLRKHRLGIVEA